MNTPTSCSFPVIEGILTRSLCSANKSGDVPMLFRNGTFNPNGRLKGISKASAKERDAHAHAATIENLITSFYTIAKLYRKRNGKTNFLGIA
jgi:hypothetical protein